MFLRIAENRIDVCTVSHRPGAAKKRIIKLTGTSNAIPGATRTGSAANTIGTPNALLII